MSKGSARRKKAISDAEETRLWNLAFRTKNKYKKVRNVKPSGKTKAV
tara:strand:+ start:390 stop:530 length:141 start_codon:yes stop_codon:yes gene_type:complete